MLIAGVSVRAAAESAARAGFRVTAVDAFDDSDRHESVTWVSARRSPSDRFNAVTAADLARNVMSDAVAYTASFENHPEAIAVLADGRQLWGNPTECLSRARAPAALAASLAAHGVHAPATYLSPPAGQPDVNRSWLIKPLNSGGGHRVRSLDADDGMYSGVVQWNDEYVQERIEGTPGSIVFAAGEGWTLPLGVSRQLIGDAAFGAHGFQYCGSILGAKGDGQFVSDAVLISNAQRLVDIVTDACRLRGVNGVDFVAVNGVPYAVEVNPRWCASMELVEAAYGVSVFEAHVAACTGRTAPPFDLALARYQQRSACGKAIVFAREEVNVGNTSKWRDRLTARDVPRPHATIGAGHPICTVFAQGVTSSACYDALVDRADAVYAAVTREGA